ncbi:MAG: RNA polymerase sigma factor [Pedococcus sp.]
MSIVRDIRTDPDLFEGFYREHLEEVQRFVARRVDDPAVAADLTADIFVAVIESAHSYDPCLGTQRAWLFGIAKHVVHTEYRRRERHGRAIGRLAGHRVLEADALEHAVERLDAQAQARALRDQIKFLAPRLRDVLELVAVDQLSVTEAATALGITPNAARVRLHRARRQLGQNVDVITPVEVAP